MSEPVHVAFSSMTPRVSLCLADVCVVKVEGAPYLCKTDEVGEICVSSGATGTAYYGLLGITKSVFEVCTSPALSVQVNSRASTEGGRQGAAGLQPDGAEAGPGSPRFTCAKSLASACSSEPGAGPRETRGHRRGRRRNPDHAGCRSLRSASSTDRASGLGAACSPPGIRGGSLIWGSRTLATWPVGPLSVQHSLTCPPLLWQTVPVTAGGAPVSDRPFTRTGLLGFIGPVSASCYHDLGLRTCPQLHGGVRWHPAPI